MKQVLILYLFGAAYAIVKTKYSNEMNFKQAMICYLKIIAWPVAIVVSQISKIGIHGAMMIANILFATATFAMASYFMYLSIFVVFPPWFAIVGMILSAFVLVTLVMYIIAITKR